MKCVITGCALIWEGAWVAGDLFDVGTHYVFNGNYNLHDQTGDGVQWIVGEPLTSKTVAPTNYWERRGVFVIDKTDVTVSPSALKYMEGL